MLSYTKLIGAATDWLDAGKKGWDKKNTRRRVRTRLKRELRNAER